jgi:predicted nuclease of predicted toxin-antitoxin system
LRFLLDAHVSGPRIGRPLEQDGHDVRALDQELALERLGDDRVLALAAEEQRILVTNDVGDFPSMLRAWAAAQRSHAGVILVYAVDHREFDLVVRGIQRCLELYPEPDSWIDLAAVVNRDFASG